MAVEPLSGTGVDNPIAWRGAVERFIGTSTARQDDADRRLDAVNGSIEKTWTAISDLRVAVGRLTVKVAIAAGTASILGSGLVSFLVLKYGKA